MKEFLDDFDVKRLSFRALLALAILRFRSICPKGTIPKLDEKILLAERLVTSADISFAAFREIDSVPGPGEPNAVTRLADAAASIRCAARHVAFFFVNGDKEFRNSVHGSIRKAIDLIFDALRLACEAQGMDPTHVQQNIAAAETCLRHELEVLANRHGQLPNSLGKPFSIPILPPSSP